MEALTKDVQQPVRTVRPATRIEALDWVKGVLILCMVAYHAIGYSVFRTLAFQYLAFLPPSFILITGFLVGQVYAAKYDLGTWKPYARLAIRGIKLLLLFIALNVGFCIALERNLVEGLWEFGDRSPAIFLSGNGRVGIFEILLPIAYFLLLAPALLWIRSRARSAIAASAAGLFALCMCLELNGISLKNLMLVSAGFVGMAFGVVPIQRIDRFARYWIPVLLIYFVYRICSFYWGERYVVQMFGSVGTLLLFYCCALRVDCASAFGRIVIVFGKYSLLAYLAQIALIRIIVHLCGGRPAHWLGILSVGLATVLLLFFTVQAVDQLRGRFRSLDVLYRSIFA